MININLMYFGGANLILTGGTSYCVVTCFLQKGTNTRVSFLSIRAAYVMLHRRVFFSREHVSSHYKSTIRLHDPVTA